MPDMAAAMPWLNLLLVPLCGLMLRSESRISKLEAQMAILLERVK